MKETRVLLSSILQRNHLPQTEFELRGHLAKKGLKLNKTTVYRLIQKLTGENVIKPVDLGDGKKRFELNLHNHHHHLVCTNCNQIEDIFVHNDVKHVENKIAKLKRFKIKSHSLEFFGVCKSCQ